MQIETKTNIILVPGWQGCKPAHWMSLWNKERVGTVWVEQDNWHEPILTDWIDTLEKVVMAQPGNVDLVCHSLGCITAAFLALNKPSSKALHRIRCAMMVAPSDLYRPACPEALHGFRPVPFQALPFPTLVVGSTDDPSSTWERTEQLAGRWGSTLVNLGNRGHINADSGLGHWDEGFAYFDDFRRNL